MFCWPSSRPIVVTSGLNAPALMFVIPAVNDGLNGRLEPGQGLPCGPLVMSNVEVLSTGAFPDHGVNTAVVV